MRQSVRFDSGSTSCAAWFYPGTNGACVIMAGGGAVTKEPGTDVFARRFHAAGFAVLAFDYRHLGESGGEPRQVVRIREGVQDWQAAIAYAGSRPGVDPQRLAIWGFSLSGGHVLRVAARDPRLAAAIAQTPNADGLAAARTAGRYQRPLATLRLMGRSLSDAIGGRLGRAPRLVPLAGEPGTVAMLATPDGLQGDHALNPGNRYPEWRQEIAARSILPIVLYRPGRQALQIRCPLLVVACAQDVTATPGPAIAAAERAPRGELLRMDGGHYAPFLEGHEAAVGAQIAFLRRHLSPVDDRVAADLRP
ncbi:MAG TPA: alpha/beta hydrolase [Mycobacteriales bacterium]|nr:alpha/beta hydrolase [Mycobacteriales bacterium]